MANERPRERTNNITSRSDFQSEGEVGRGEDIDPAFGRRHIPTRRAVPDADAFDEFQHKNVSCLKNGLLSLQSTSGTTTRRMGQ